MRDQLIQRYAPLVRHAVGSFAATRTGILDAEDIYSYGTMGLIDAIDRFDSTRGVKFETYAVTRIRGYLIDQLRELDWLPRTARAHVRTVQRSAARLEERLGRYPDRDELARETGLAPAICERALADSGNQMVSLEGLSQCDDENSTLTLLHRLVDESSPNPAVAAERHEFVDGLQSALNALPSREREILHLRYVRNWTLKQVAQHLHVSESRASQLHAQAIGRMRTQLRVLFGDLTCERLTA
jgi:RNA polymerase sigma factor for flagellar operon FliA